MAQISLLDLYLTFLKTGAELLGGGFVIVPVLTRNIISGKGWISREELTKYYALSGSIPGIIAVNVSTFIGYKLRGKLGALVSILGIITSPFIIICLIASVLNQLTEMTLVQNIFYGVGIAVIIVVYLAVKEMWEYSVVDIPTIIIFLGALIASFFFNVSPVVIIICSVLGGILTKYMGEKFKK